MKRLSLVVVCSVFGAWGCNVDDSAETTGGVGPEARGECAAGHVVVMSDYVSTEVALTDLAGQTLSPSFISTAASQTNGLAFALSGDVVLPSSRSASGAIVLIDRFGTNVVSWLDPQSGSVIAQLPVGTGFESNPMDYLEVSPELALVSRWGQNSAPGKEPNDIGGDVLLVDLNNKQIAGSVVLEGTGDLPPRPGALTLWNNEVIVSLSPLSLDFQTHGESSLVGIAPAERAVTWSVPLSGLVACGGAALLPSGKKLVVSCTGEIGATGEVEDLSQSALVVFDATVSPPRELTRFSAESLAGEALQGEVEPVDDRRVLVKTQTALGSSHHNRLLAVDLETGASETLLTAGPDASGAGQGLVFGGISCAPGCSDICLLSDGDRGVLQPIKVAEQFEVLEPLNIAGSAGLPPHDVGQR